MSAGCCLINRSGENPVRAEQFGLRRNDRMSELCLGHYRVFNPMKIIDGDDHLEAANFGKLICVMFLDMILE